MKNNININFRDAVCMRKETINPNSFPEEEFDYFSIPSLDISAGSERTLGKKIMSNKFLIKSDCVLISKLNPRIPRICLARINSHKRSICSTEFIPLYVRDGKTDLGYLSHFLLSAAFQKKFQSIAGGSTNSHSRVTPSEILNLEFYRPSLAEQKKIAQILSSIDELLLLLTKKKNKLNNLKFGLFNELIINNKNAIFKKISDICSTSSGGTPDRSNLNYFKGNIPWVKSGEVKGFDILQTEEQITNEAINNSSAKIIKSGSVLIAMYGATAGQCALLRVNAATNQAVLSLSVNSNCLDNTYLYHALSASKNNLLLSCQGSGQPNLSSTLIKNFSIPVPALSTQNQINRTLNLLSKNIDTLNLKIKKIKELKKSISSDLLTGSRKVSVL